MLDKNFIKLSTEDPNYPKKLIEVGLTPELYIIGNKQLLNTKNIVAIVGSRRAKQKALEFTEKLARELAQRGVTVISGGALGIDSFAHKGAMGTLGNTMVILGSGLSNIYPRRNIPLFNEIVQNGGTIISHFHPDTPPFKRNFPQRNCIIAALSELVIVVRAGEKSGVFSTVNFAIKFNRKVGIVPGCPWEEDALGINIMLQKLKDKIHIIKEWEDVFRLMDVSFDKCPERSFEIKLKAPMLDMPPLVQKLLNLLREKPRHWDELVEILNIPQQQLATILLDLELNSIIKDIGNKVYAIIGEEDG